MEQLLAHKYLQALDTISRLAPLLADRLEPARGNAQDSFKAPTRPTSKPPCNLTWLDLQIQVENLLRWACLQTWYDLPGKRTPPPSRLKGMAAWLADRADHLEACMWLDSETWWQMQTGVKGTTLARETINHAHLLTEALDPPAKHPPAGTATQMCLATGVPAETIRTWGKRGRIPRFKGPHGAWLYRVADIKQMQR